MRKLKGVLLDVDGTLVDSNDVHWPHAWVRALEEQGITVPYEKVRRLIGKGGDKLLPEVAGFDANFSKGRPSASGAARSFRQSSCPRCVLSPEPRNCWSGCNGRGCAGVSP